MQKAPESTTVGLEGGRGWEGATGAGRARAGPDGSPIRVSAVFSTAPKKGKRFSLLSWARSTETAWWSREGLRFFPEAASRNPKFPGGCPVTAGWLRATAGLEI